MADHKYSINIQHFVLNPVAIYQSRNPKWSKKTMLETKVDQETSVVFAHCIAKEKHGHNKNDGKWRRNKFKTNLFSQGGGSSQVPCFLLYPKR